MEEADLLIKELRIDNETLLSPDYNPLKALFENNKSTYRNTYHRVEKVMEGIINLTYKGFSDSVLSYMEIYNLNSKNVSLLSDTSSLLKNIQSTTFNTGDIKDIYNNTRYLKVKCDISDILKELSLIKKDDNALIKKDYDFIRKSNLLIRAKNLIKDNNLQLIEGIDILRNDLLLEIDHFMSKVYDKVSEYIYKDKIEYKELLRIIKRMDKIESFDKYLLKNSNNNNIDNNKYNNIDNNVDNNKYNNNVDNNILDKLISINEYFNIHLSLYKKLINIKPKLIEEEDNTILLLEDSAFTKVDYSTETLQFYKYDINININMMINRVRDIYKNRDISYYLINTLILINKKHNSEKLSKLIEKYLNIKQSEIEEEVLYLFDTFCREGNYKNDYYINKIVYNINKNIKIINLRPDIITNIVKKIRVEIKSDNVDFKEKVMLLDEILGEYTDECII